jgi:hypothetical protein
MIPRVKFFFGWVIEWLLARNNTDLVGPLFIITGKYMLDDLIRTERDFMIAPSKAYALRSPMVNDFKIKIIQPGIKIIENCCICFQVDAAVF